jgi:hypothetical protein
MKPTASFKQWLATGVLAEALIFGYCYLNFAEIGEVFRHAARYSGRLSLVIYLGCFYYFASNYHFKEALMMGNLKKMVTIFCVLHFIHFGFLVMNVLLNHVHLIPYKLAGGFVAYLMILIYPWAISRRKMPKIAHLVYFYYVGIVMAITYVARMKGDFEGVSPHPIHFIAFGAVIIAFIVFSFLIFKPTKTNAVS